MLVPAGSIVELQVSTVEGFTQSSNDILAAVEPLPNGLLVKDFSVVTPSLVSTIGAGILLSSQAIVLDIKVQTPMDRASENDIAADVQIAFNNAGIQASAISVVNVNNQGTGQPAITPPTGSGQDLGTTISNFLSGLGTSTVIILVVLVGVIVLVLVLAAYGPNAGAIAKAVTI